MVEWPEALIRDIARRRSVVVIGAGVSMNSVGINNARPPDWEKFLRDCNNNHQHGPDAHITKAIDEGDLLHACEWLQRKYDADWKSVLRKSFSAPKFKPSPVHRTIAELDNRIIFSLNFDDIFERAANEVYEGTSVKKSYYDPDVSEFLRGTERYIVKVHGSLDATSQLIFTQKQYAEARVKAAAFYNAFDSALMTHTFLFLGAGYRDPDINLVLENQNFTYSESHPHYYLTETGMHEDLKSSLRKNRNLQVIEFDPIDDNYSGFRQALEDLLQQVEGKRQDLANTLDW